MEPIEPTCGQIRAARALLNWSRADLAHAIGVSPSTVARIENGDEASRSAVNLRAIRSVFEDLGLQFASGGVQWRDKPACG